MFKRISSIVIVVLLCLCFSGCVKRSTYLKKVDKANNLSKKFDDLLIEHNDLKDRIAMLEIENEELKQKITDLEKERIDLQINNEKNSNTYGEIIKKMESEVSQGQVTITELKGKLRVKMLNSILFASGKAKVSEEGMGVLQKLIEVLKEVEDHEIRVEGHTDNVPISEYLASRHPTNWDLSAARAINVVKYLQEQGIDPAALSSSAFGEHRPVAGNETEEDRAKNRRIEIILVPIVLSDNNVSSTL